MNLIDIVKDLDEVLNSAENPTPYYFNVRAVGVHIDRIDNREHHTNEILVFVSKVGGNYNPILGLNENTSTIQISIYFPVRFKEDMFLLDEYLHQNYVGSTRPYGNVISNLSVSQLGEIQDLDLTQFSKWASEFYEKPIEVMEPYMTLNLNLYLSEIADGYVYGNEITASLLTPVTKAIFAFNDGRRENAIQIGEGLFSCLGKIYEANPTYGSYVYDPELQLHVGRVDEITENQGIEIPLTFADASLQSNSQSSDHCNEGDNESSGLPYSNTLGASFAFYLPKGDNGNLIVNEFFTGVLPYRDFFLKLNYGTLKLQKPVYIQSLNMPISKGQPIRVTISLGRKYGL